MTTATANPVVQAATDLMSVLWAAELRGLPLPFVARAYDTGDELVVLQVHTADEVTAWADAMEVDVVRTGGNHVARGELLDVRVTVSAWVSA